MPKKLKKKTKILAAGDVHGDTGLVKKLAKKAEKEDAKKKIEKKSKPVQTKLI